MRLLIQKKEKRKEKNRRGRENDATAAANFEMS